MVAFTIQLIPYLVNFEKKLLFVYATEELFVSSLNIPMILLVLFQRLV